MVRPDEWYAFLACVVVGIASGVVYELFFYVERLLKKRLEATILDVVFVLVVAVAFSTLSAMLSLPPFRAYMLLALILGFCLSWKSLHETLAFFGVKVYNRVKEKAQRKERKCRVRVKKERESS